MGRLRDVMIERTHRDHAPWFVVDFNDQKRGRLALIRDLLARLPDTRLPETQLDFTPLAGKPAKERYGVVQPLPINA
jgi:hypothetical protein